MDLLSSYASLSVKNLEDAIEFYQEKLGLELVMDARPGMVIFSAADTRFMLYTKEDHQPASHTVLNFAVEDIAEAVKQLKNKGIKFEDDEQADKDGILTRGPLKIAWFKDSEGNNLSITEGF